MKTQFFQPAAMRVSPDQSTSLIDQRRYVPSLTYNTISFLSAVMGFSPPRSVFNHLQCAPPTPKPPAVCFHPAAIRILSPPSPPPPSTSCGLFSTTCNARPSPSLTSCGLFSTASNAQPLLPPLNRLQSVFNQL